MKEKKIKITRHYRFWKFKDLVAFCKYIKKQAPTIEKNPVNQLKIIKI